MMERVKPVLYFVVFGLMLSTLWVVAVSQSRAERLDNGWRAPKAVPAAVRASLSAMDAESRRVAITSADLEDAVGR